MNIVAVVIVEDEEVFVSTCRRHEEFVLFGLCVFVLSFGYRRHIHISNVYLDLGSSLILVAF